MTTIFLYQLLSTRSKRALLSRRKGRFGLKPYVPRMLLLNRLAKESGLSVQAVRNQLLEERTQLRKQGN